jgi:hypothetical protein
MLSWFEPQQRALVMRSELIKHMKDLVPILAHLQCTRYLQIKVPERLCNSDARFKVCQRLAFPTSAYVNGPSAHQKPTCATARSERKGHKRSLYVAAYTVSLFQEALWPERPRLGEIGFVVMHAVCVHSDVRAFWYGCAIDEDWTHTVAGNLSPECAALWRADAQGLVDASS